MLFINPTVPLHTSSGPVMLASSLKANNCSEHGQLDWWLITSLRHIKYLVFAGLDLRFKFMAAMLDFEMSLSEKPSAVQTRNSDLKGLCLI